MPERYPRAGGRHADPERRRVRPGSERHDHGGARARHAERRDRHGARGRVRLRLSRQRLQERAAGAMGRAGGHLPAAARRGADHRPTPTCSASSPRAAGGRSTLADVRETVLAIRRTKSMVLDDPDDPNRHSCGSFFLNPILRAVDADGVTARAGDPAMPRWPQPDGRVKLSAAWLIERAGFARGARAGAVGLSTQHTLAIVAHEGARAARRDCLRARRAGCRRRAVRRPAHPRARLLGRLTVPRAAACRARPSVIAWGGFQATSGGFHG